MKNRFKFVLFSFSRTIPRSDLVIEANYVKVCFISTHQRRGCLRRVWNLPIISVCLIKLKLKFVEKEENNIKKRYISKRKCLGIQDKVHTLKREKDPYNKKKLLHFSKKENKLYLKVWTCLTPPHYVCACPKSGAWSQFLKKKTYE